MIETLLVLAANVALLYVAVTLTHAFTRAKTWTRAREITTSLAMDAGRRVMEARRSGHPMAEIKAMGELAGLSRAMREIAEAACGQSPQTPPKDARGEREAVA